MALVITLKRNETVEIGDVKLKIRGVNGTQFSVVIDAPKEMKVLRSGFIRGDKAHVGSKFIKGER